MPPKKQDCLSAPRVNDFKKLIHPKFLPAFLLFFVGVCAQGQQWQQEAMSLRKTLEANHYSQRTIDDKLSEQIVFQLLESLDPNRLYFLQSDWKEIAAYRHLVDDELAGNSWKLVPRLTELYRQRLSQADKRIGDLTQKAFVFSTDETVTYGKTGTDSLLLAADEKELQQRWVKRLKHLVIKEMVANTDEIVSGNLDKINAREPAARQKVQLTEKRKLKRVLEHPGGFEAVVATAFFNTVAECFDPHSNYFSPVNKKNFEASLATEGLSFGMDLDENEEGDVIIARLVPGGPAWKSNELHKGDVLVTLKWENKNAVSLTGADVYEVEDMLNASSSDRLEITVRTANGVEKKVSLIREKIREDENIVKSYILKGDKTIGYIALPGFYTETEDASSLGCANDVAKEIIKLKEAKIEGLILDIRSNGGGSLREGMSLAGIFIDEGPLGMMQGTDRKPLIMKDMNRGTVYDGPLVVMVNSQSASASEFLAATLQDYNRAVVVGSATYGKATGQIVLPLSANANPMAMKEARSSWGSAKVTTIKLYRVTGKSAQLKGVQPHIYQPDIYEALNHRESANEFALSSDSVSKKLYFSSLQALPVSQLSEKSKIRQDTSAGFRSIRKLNEALKNRQQKNTIVLHPSSYRSLVLEAYQALQIYQKATEHSTSVFKVENTGYDKEVIKIDSYRKEINDNLIDTIQKDVYIDEAFRIMKDFIELKTHK